jgi:hypothetical protein
MPSLQQQSHKKHSCTNMCASDCSKKNSYDYSYKLSGLKEYAHEKYGGKRKDIMHLCFYIPTKESWVNMITYGENSMRRSNSGLPSTHAEMDGLRRIRVHHSRNPKRNKDCYDIIVIRLSKSGKLGISRPCYHCLKSLSESNINIKYVYYSTGNGDEIVRESLNEMLNNEVSHISAGWRRKMGIDNDYYCKHIIQKKLNETSLHPESQGRSIFRQYLERYKEHLLSIS